MSEFIVATTVHIPPSALRAPSELDPTPDVALLGRLCSFIIVRLILIVEFDTSLEIYIFQRSDE